MSMQPWLVCPEFTAERMQLLASEMARVREKLALTYQPELGDDPWCFGCQAYSRTCFAIERCALSGDYPWLQVNRLGLRCKISIGGETLSFFHGDPRSPSSRSLRRGLSDLIGAKAFPFFEEELAADEGVWFWLLAIETNDDGTVARVVTLQANSNRETRHHWDVPMEAPSTQIAPVISIVRQPVHLPAPVVGPKLITGQDRAASDNGEPGSDGADD